jgi:hypothetical protein
MYIISFNFQRTMDVTVYHQCSDIELVSPVYFCNDGSYHEYPIERTDHGTVTKIGFRFDPNRNSSGSILMYKVQRKVNTRSDHQSSIDVIYTNVIEETLKMIRLLVIWKVEYLKKPEVKAMLVEYDNKLVLNEDELVQLYNNAVNMSFNYDTSYYLGRENHILNKYTALVCDHAALKVVYDEEWKDGLELKINISGVEYNARDIHIIKLMWIDPKR